jgi:predicted transcriptional regulator
MDVLLSIRPHFAERIFNGTKKYEYRKTIFSRADVQKVVVYASSPVKKIVGEFQIAEIIWDKPEILWLKTRSSAGLDWDFFLQYFIGKDKGYAISIKYTKRYEVPIDPWGLLRDFTPPQSFRYIDSNNLLPLNAWTEVRASKGGVSPSFYFSSLPQKGGVPEAPAYEGGLGMGRKT